MWKPKNSLGPITDTLLFVFFEYKTCSNFRPKFSIQKKTKIKTCISSGIKGHSKEQLVKLARITGPTASATVSLGGRGGSTWTGWLKKYRLPVKGKTLGLCTKPFNSSVAVTLRRSTSSRIEMETCWFSLIRLLWYGGSILLLCWTMWKFL